MIKDDWFALIFASLCGFAIILDAFTTEYLLSLNGQEMNMIILYFSSLMGISESDVVLLIKGVFFILVV